MRLLLLDQFSDLGGAQRMLLDLLPAIIACGWDAVLAIPGHGPLRNQAEALGCPVEQIGCALYSAGRKSTADLGRFLIELPRLARQLLRLAERMRPDLIYINGPRILPAVAWAGLSQPVLFHAHIAISQLAVRLLAGQSLRRLNARIIAVCEAVGTAWRKFGEVTVIHNGVAGPSSPRTIVSRQSRVIGCIGRIAPEKGQREFLESAARIHQALPDARFLICGAALFSDRAAMRYERHIRQAATSLPVEFTGWVPDVYPVMQRLDLLLVPSVWNEPNPRVVLEAFAAGVPVIAFRSGGLPEIIEDGRTGFLCNNTWEMADLAIALLTSRSARLSEVAISARENWRANFSLERWQERMLAEIDCAAGAEATTTPPHEASAAKLKHGARPSR